MLQQRIPLRAGPDYADPTDMWVDAVCELMPPEEVSVSDAANRHRVLDNRGGGFSGPWSESDRTPYLTEIMDTLGSGRYPLIAIQGPAQSAKTEAALNWLLRDTVYDPADFIWLQTSKEVARTFVQAKVAPMIAHAPALRKRQLTTASADNIFSKQFKGATWYFAWPVADQLQMKSVPRFVVDDFDRVPQDIGGEGSPLYLLSGRQTSFEGAEIGCVISSPALGEDAGIEPIYKKGTQKTMRWPCPECGEYFEVDFKKIFHCKMDGTQAEAEQSAGIICPDCGSFIAPTRKAWMARRGRWASPGQTVTPDGVIEGDEPEVQTASFRIDGLMGFRSWGKLASMYWEASETFKVNQDESELQAFWNTAIGFNYKSQLSGKDPLVSSDLDDRKKDYLLGEIPSWVGGISAAVDIQSNRFAVAVWGWGENNRNCLVDRFDITHLDDAGRVPLTPFENAAHWSVLLTKVFGRVWPVQGETNKVMAVFNVAIDTGGEGDATDNAKRFWTMARRTAGVPDKRITLIKGGSKKDTPVSPKPTFLENKIVKRKEVPDVNGPKMYVIGVNTLKGVIDTRLRREDGQFGTTDLPQDLPEQYSDELVSEQIDKDGWWCKKKNGIRNETFDLAVYNEFARRRWAKTRIDMRWVPSWGRVKELSKPQEAVPARGEINNTGIHPPVKKGGYSSMINNMV